MDAKFSARVLDEERKAASFDVEAMTHLLYGGAAQTARRRWIFSAHEGAAASHAVHEMTREKQIAWSVEHFMSTHGPHFSSGYKPKDQDMQYMSDARISNSNLTINFGVFASTLRSQASDFQKSLWLDRAQRGQITGCYAQTEIAHGSNVRGLQTTATYDPANEQWIIHTPNIGAIKCWSTGMTMATHAVIWAQAIVGGKNHGLHPFMVQMRGADLKPLPGIQVGDMGLPQGETDCTIGYCRFDQVRIPRRFLLERRVHVTKEGEFKHEAEPGSMKQVAKQTKKLDSKAAQALKYVTMMKTRIALASTASGALAKACTITARYSVQRRQGFKPDQSESQIIDYSNQSFRVCKWLASTYAFKSITMWLVRRRRAIESGGEVNLDELPEVHALGSGLKSELTMEASLGIEDLRKACGGHGFLMSSGIAALEADFKGPNTTAEGDPYLLYLQLARFLVKEFRRARIGESVHGLCKIFSAMADPLFDPARDARKLLGLPATPSVSDLQDYRFLVRLFQLRSLVVTSRAVRRLEALEKQPGMSAFQAWNKTARLLVKASQCHVRYFIIHGFATQIEETKDNVPCQAVLARLCALYGVADLVEGPVQWGSVLADEACADNVEEVALTLCDQLRPDLIALTDAFDFPDRVLNTVLGRRDGNYEEVLLDQAQRSSLNHIYDADGNAREPEFLQKMRPYLDIDFLKYGNALLPDAKL